ncbi:hypothetical protein K438DRAFT_1767324 [Mycena galopus ATCC 62051]|nr:hypothetical protein K438DRAFT_1767324 [Mycena galopus ATCC 62051]
MSFKFRAWQAQATRSRSLIHCSSLDIFITVAFIWKLHMPQSPFPATTSTSYLGLLHIVDAIQTGFTKSIVALAMRKSYYADKHSLQYPFDACTHLQVAATAFKPGSFTNPSLTVDFCMDGIHVHRSATVSIGPANCNTQGHIGCRIPPESRIVRTIIDKTRFQLDKGQQQHRPWNVHFRHSILQQALIALFFPKFSRCLNTDSKPGFHDRPLRKILLLNTLTSLVYIDITWVSKLNASGYAGYSSETAIAYISTSG